MWDFDLTRAITLMGRTSPFILLRLLVCVGIALGYILVTGIGAGIGYAVTAQVTEMAGAPLSAA